MKKYSASQKKIMTDFLGTIAAWWFGAGVITTVFARSLNFSETAINLVIGGFMTYLSLRFALYLDKRKV